MSVYDFLLLKPCTYRLYRKHFKTTSDSFQILGRQYYLRMTSAHIACIANMSKPLRILSKFWVGNIICNSQWISLLYRRVQKIDEIEPDHCDRYQNNCTKKCNWMALVSYIGNGGNIGQISLKCRKLLNLIKLLKSWQFLISLKTFGGLKNYFK